LTKHQSFIHYSFFVKTKSSKKIKIMILRLFFITIFTSLSFNIFAQNFETSVKNLLDKPDYKNASIGMNVVDLTSGETIYSLFPDRVLIPASTMKMITSGTALEVLGSDYRFKTKIGYSGKINKKGELDGNLIIIGGADPALGSKYFKDFYDNFLQNWATAVQKAGIKKIKGKLILDGSIYDSERIPSDWVWADMGNYYGAGPCAFTVYDNMYKITFSSPKEAGKLTTVTKLEPKIKGMTFQNEVLSSDENYDNAYVFGGPLDKKRIIRGTIPKDREAFTIKASTPQPEEVLAQDFTNALKEIGIEIPYETEYTKTDSTKFKEIFVQQSPTLAEIAEVLNHESVNLFAEHFLKQLAVEEAGIGNRQKGIEFIHNYWKNKGLDTKYLYMEDGSGLSHFNLVSPHFFTQYLTLMANNQDFLTSLPNAGNGTLKRFSTETFPGKTIQAKSGSMTRVRCYSGYLKTDSGKTLVFSFMFNHFDGSHTALRKEIEKLFATLKTEY
jgi:D-alanyl-D-alanine carboxypeptidase/D-alanyl-D-alanine-endopeptidase (penicillin-binding protein 4)